MLSKLNRRNPKFTLANPYREQILEARPEVAQEKTMQAQHARARMRCILVSVAHIVVIGILTVLFGTVLEHEWTRHQAEAQIHEEEVRNAAQWRDAIHRWNAGAQARRPMQSEMDSIKAGTRNAR